MCPQFPVQVNCRIDVLTLASFLGKFGITDLEKLRRKRRFTYKIISDIFIYSGAFGNICAIPNEKRTVLK
jgi:hypothetical protein